MTIHGWSRRTRGQATAATEIHTHTHTVKQVSATLALSINDFYDGLQDQFLAAFAYVMGISLDSIQVRDNGRGCKQRAGAKCH